MRSVKSKILACTGAFALLGLAGAAHADALATPSMAGPLAANPNPFSVDLPDWFGDAGGKVYVGGDLSGLVYAESNPQYGGNGVGDASSFADISNGQVWIQKTDGWLQFFVEAGAYSFPTVGVPYTDASNTDSVFGYVPIAYAKLQGEGALASFSLEAGKLPTLIGDEYGFTFQNMNIERGLLWNLEPIVSRGVQLNYSQGPITVSVSLNDGFYTNTYNNISGLASYAFNGGADTLAFTAEGNLASNFHYYGNVGLTSSIINSGSVYDLIYTHTSGPWTISPYVQYVSTAAGQVWGGAVLASYSIDDNWKLAGRFEYESQTTHYYPNFLYGYGSNAFSVTVTPSYQWKIYYARADLSYVSAGDITPGDAFGNAGTTSGQFRAMFEAGVLF